MYIIRYRHIVALCGLLLISFSLHAQIPQQYNTGVTLDLPEDAEAKTVQLLLISGERVKGKLVHASYSGDVLIYNTTDSIPDPVDIYNMPIQDVDSVSFHGNRYGWEGAATGAIVSFVLGTILFEGLAEGKDRRDPSAAFGAALALIGTPLGGAIGFMIRDYGPGAIVHTENGHVEAIDHLQDYQLYDEDDPELLDLLQRIEAAEEE